MEKVVNGSSGAPVTGSKVQGCTMSTAYRGEGSRGGGVWGLGREE